jgi:GT2 family glycosyltransferase
MTADISIVIVNLDTRLLLRQCLASVFRCAPPLSIEVIVVDNGSTDGSPEMVSAEFPAVKLVRNARNEGFAHPNNVGMELAEGRHILLLNSDTEVGTDTFHVLVHFLDDHPDVGACGPMLVFPDGRIQHSVKGFPTPFTRFCDIFFLDRLFPASRLFGRGEMRSFDYSKAAPVDHVMAAAFLVRREVLHDVGLLDERFAIYYNDMDWCFRMHASGWAIWYLPQARVVHHLGRTVDSLNRQFALFRILHENVLLFYQKHYGRWSVVFYRFLTIIGFVPRSIGWSGLAALRPSDYTKHMRAFSWKTLRWALPVWRPAMVVGTQDIQEGER